MSALDEHGLAQLSRFLDFAEGQFDLAMVRVDTASGRTALGEWLRERVSSLTLLDLDTIEASPLARVRELGALGDVVLVTGLEGRTDEVFRALNVQRDALMEAAPVPWVLAGHRRGLSDLQQVAPDFCDLVSVHVTLVVGPEQPLRVRELAWMPRNAHSGVWTRVASIDVRARADRAEVASNDARTADAESIEEAYSLLDAGRPREARDLLEQWLIRARRMRDEDPRDLASGLQALGTVRHALGDLDGARRMLEEALELRTDAEPDAPFAASLHELARVLLAQGDLAGARAHLERTLAIDAKVFGTDEHPDVATSLHALASVLQAQGDLPAAREHLERALAIYAKVFGTDEHPSVAASFHELARVLQAQGDLPAAREHLERALSVHAKVFGTDEHPRVAASLHSLATLLAVEGRSEQAIDILRRVLLIEAKLYQTRDHFSSAETEVGLARLLLERGQTEEARELLRHAAEVFERQVPNHPLLAQIHERLEAPSRSAPDPSA